MVPISSHPRLDRFMLALSITAVTVLFIQRLSTLSPNGQLTPTRFLQYFAAGGICAFITHAACTPIDVVKTRIQTTQGRYHSMLDAFTKIVSEEGASTLLKGLGATASGYFLHGAFKYSFYEVFKVILSPSAEMSVKPPLPIAALSGLCAECIACMLLCPMEAIRIRSVADSAFPSGVTTGLSVLLKAEGVHGLYKGLPAMLLKQVPYTVGQFVSFEFAVIFVKAALYSVNPTDTNTSTFASVSSFAGVFAGISAAVMSHPGDTILSKVNQEESDGSPMAQIVRVARATGVPGLFIGLGPRLIQVGFMIGGQFLIYDAIKLWCGITPASALPLALPVAAAAAVTQQLATGVVSDVSKNVVSADSVQSLVDKTR